MEPHSESMAEWLDSLESMLHKLQNRSFLGLFDTKSLARLDEMLSAKCLSVRSCRNARTFPNRLPPEILASVFLNAQEDSMKAIPDTMFRRRWRDSPFPRMSVMLVCRYWRDIMLAFRSLWRTIFIPGGWTNTSSVKHIEHCLARSASGVLDVYAKTYDAEALMLIANQSSRLRNLYLSIDDRFYMDFALRELSHPVPQLECLCLCYLGDSDSPVFLPHQLFDDQAHSLRRLVLRGNIRWDEKSFSTLTHLTLEGDLYPGTEMSRVLYRGLLSLLRANSALEQFEIAGLHHWFENHDREAPVMPVKLDRLQRLSVASSEAHHAGWLLRSLVLPSGTLLSCSLNYVPGDVMFCAIPGDISALDNLRQITALTIFDDPQVGFAKAIGTGPFSGFYFAHDDFHFYRHTPRTESERFHSISIDDLSRLPLAAQLKELWLTRGPIDENDSDGPDASQADSDNLSMVDWTPDYRVLFERTVSLTKLYVNGGLTQEVLKDLMPRTERGGILVRSQCLEVLMVDEGPDLPRELLLSFAQRRAEAGCPIRKLSIALGSGHDEPDDLEYLQSLRQYIQDVDPGLEELPQMDVPPDWSTHRHGHWPAWSLKQ